MSGITITFGDVAENHVGMQKVGTLSQNGYSIDELEEYEAKMLKLGYEACLIRIDNYIDVQVEPAGILIVKNYCSSHKEVFDELASLDWDSKAFMYGRVVNKHARRNLIFSDEDQEPDYEHGKGRIISFTHVPLLGKFREKITKDFEKDLHAEGNYYHDLSKCGIGWHGDAERKKVIGCRFGDPYSLFFRWHLGKKAISERLEIELDSGDIYMMSEKASGNDWKLRTVPTLRHSAGYSNSDFTQ